MIDLTRVQWGFHCTIYGFLFVVLWFIVCHFGFFNFRLEGVLSVILRFKASNYPFGIFKLFSVAIVLIYGMK